MQVYVQQNFPKKKKRKKVKMQLRRPHDFYQKKEVKRGQQAWGLE